jgi:DNA-binding winged helix-turn-helix (wHTH) protein/tetratricopeptide (TPR) repeat protein
MTAGTERRVGDVRVEVETGVLQRGEQTRTLEPRVMDVLVALLDADGRVVTRDELIDAVWHGRPGADAALTTAVSKLRRALNELGGSPERIRTVPKRGYQLLAPEEDTDAADECRRRADDLPSPGSPATDGVIEPAGRVPERTRSWRPVAALLLAGIAVVVFWMIDRSPSPSPSASVAAGPTRLAVAAFAGAGETGALALGIAEEIRSRLAAHPELQLVNLPGAAGGVDTADFGTLDEEAIDYVLTGRVRPGTDPNGPEAIRLAVRLDRVSDRTSVWGDVLVLPDVALFDAEQRIAEAVAAALPGLGPLPPPLQPVAADPLAYSLYVQAIGLLRRGFLFSDEVRRAYLKLERAVEIDPDFALAWAAMAIVLSQQERWYLDTIERTAWQALARAEALDHDHPDVLIARGTVQLVHGQAPGVDQPLDLVAPFLDALALRPGSVRARLGLAEALAASNQHRAAVRVAESALVRSPRDPAALMLTSRLNAATRNWARAEALAARNATLQPDNYLPINAQANYRLLGTGDPRAALAILERAPAELMPDKVWAEFYDYAGEHAKIIERADVRIAEHGVEGFAVQWPVFALFAAHAFRVEGQPERARPIAEAARTIYVRSLSPGTEEWIARSGLAAADYLAGRPDSALLQSCLAVDAWRARGGDSPVIYEEFARTAALLGHLDLARSLVDQLVRVDYGRTPLNLHALRLEPAWQPLREAPGFEDWLATFPPPSRTVDATESAESIDFESFRQPRAEAADTFDASGVDALCAEAGISASAMNS